jgi:hypothetical protein
MTELIHVSPESRIYVEGGAVVVHVVCGPSGLPMWLEFSGEAVVGLLNAAQKAFSVRAKDRRAIGKQSRESTAARMRLRRAAND